MMLQYFLASARAHLKDVLKLPPDFTSLPWILRWGDATKDNKGASVSVNLSSVIFSFFFFHFILVRYGTAQYYWVAISNWPATGRAKLMSPTVQTNIGHISCYKLIGTFFFFFNLCSLCITKS